MMTTDDGKSRVHDDPCQPAAGWRPTGTDLSQLPHELGSRTTPDSGVNAGQPVDHDLRIRTPAHCPHGHVLLIYGSHAPRSRRLPVVHPTVRQSKGVHSQPVPVRHLSSDGQALSNPICVRDVAGRLKRGRRRRPGMNVCRPSLRPTWRPETPRDGRDGRRMAHNPEVQIPPPLPRPEAFSRTEKGPLACGLRTIARPAMTCRDR
jgi:hypothetical protein